MTPSIAANVHTPEKTTATGSPQFRRSHRPARTTPRSRARSPSAALGPTPTAPADAALRATERFYPLSLEGPCGSVGSTLGWNRRHRSGNACRRSATARSSRRRLARSGRPETAENPYQRAPHAATVAPMRPPTLLLLKPRLRQHLRQRTNCRTKKIVQCRLFQCSLAIFPRCIERYNRTDRSERTSRSIDAGGTLQVAAAVTRAGTPCLGLFSQSIRRDRHEAHYVPVRNRPASGRPD